MTDPLPRLSAALADRYRIERELGQGGMATVYLAEDLKHDRKVALKVLKPELAAVIGAERFVVEIKTTAALQHPHILPLFDSGTADSFLYYVMPFIDGETLRSKLDRETQLGIEEAVSITSAVADALDYAHRHGVIHRDIKPENILLHDGRPMVADFGIALALSAAAGGRMTETGMSLGTPHYMSPEQATAEKDISARSDVYSLGSVLYEMLTGNPPHTGASAQQIIMKIVTEEAAPVTNLRKAVPNNVAAAVAKALEKLAADRFESAKAFGDALGDSHYTTPRLAATRGAAVAGARRGLTVGLGAALAVMTAVAAWALFVPRAAPPAVPFHSSLSDTLLPLPNGIAISPDGRTVVLAAQIGGSTQLFLRSAEGEQFRPIVGTEDAVQPMFSPDGRTLAFRQPVAGRGIHSLRRLSLVGGVIQTIVDSAIYASWGADGTIMADRGGALYRIPGGTGVPEPVFSSETMAVTSPTVLPDGKGALFSSNEVGAGGIYLLDFKTKAVTALFENGFNPRYVAPGFIIYHAPAPSVAVMAAPFDLPARQITGPPIPVLSDVWRFNGIAHWDVSDNGTLVYVQAPQVGDGERLSWVDMAGTGALLPLQVADFETPRVSPDGRRIAYLDFNSGVTSVYDISTGATTRLGGYVTHAWGPDSRSLYVAELVGSTNNILRVPVDGAGAIDTLLQDAGWVFDVSPDGTWVILGRVSEGRGNDIDILRIDGASPVIEPYLRANWNERQGDISPDGRWMAYASDESGRNEIYVRSFPEPGAPVQISDSGGVGPAWAPDGSTIYYAGGQWMMRASLSLQQGQVTVRSRTRLFPHSGLEVTTASFFQTLGFPRRYDVDPTSNRFLMVQSKEEVFNLGVPVRVVTNWFEELKQLAAEGQKR